MELRKIPDNFPFKIRSSGAMTLILEKDGGFTFENSSPVQKDALVAQYDPTDCGNTLLMAWTGQYKTDIFIVTPHDLERFYK